MSTKPNKKRSQRNLTLTIVTTITIVTWVGFEAYRTYITTQIKPATRELLTPLQPELATEVLTGLKEKIGLPRTEITKNLPVVTTLPTEAPTATSTPTLDLETDPEASPGPEIQI